MGGRWMRFCVYSSHTALPPPRLSPTPMAVVAAAGDVAAGAVLGAFHAHGLAGVDMTVRVGAALQAVDVALLAFQPQLLAWRDLALLHAMRDALGLARLPVVHARGLVVGQ